MVGALLCESYESKTNGRFKMIEEKTSLQVTLGVLHCLLQTHGAFELMLSEH